MTLRGSRTAEYEGVGSVSAMAMAMFEQTGLRELIDSRFGNDPRVKLTPGNAVKALIGDMMGSRGCSALYNVSTRSCPLPLTSCSVPRWIYPHSEVGRSPGTWTGVQ